ncbi:MAG: hypothetical protein AAF439_09055 [Pseudomonadota bacterium]
MADKLARRWARRDARPSPEVHGFYEWPDIAGRERFLNEHILVHTHISKSGGTALAEVLIDIVGSARSLDVRRARAVPIRRIGPEDLTHLSLISGHFGADLMADQDWGRRKLFIAAVRDPADRAVSIYRFLAGKPALPAHNLVAGREFEEVWQDREQMVGLNGMDGDLQSRQVTGTARGEELDRARVEHQLSEGYLLIVPNPQIDAAQTKLRAAFGVFAKKRQRLNVSRFQEIAIPDTLRQEIRAANPTDTWLYENAVAQFDEKLEQACAFIANHCLQKLEP